MVLWTLFRAKGVLERPSLSIVALWLPALFTAASHAATVAIAFLSPEAASFLISAKRRGFSFAGL